VGCPCETLSTRKMVTRGVCSAFPSPKNLRHGFLKIDLAKTQGPCDLPLSTILLSSMALNIDRMRYSGTSSPILALISLCSDETSRASPTLISATTHPAKLTGASMPQFLYADTKESRTIHWGVWGVMENKTPLCKHTDINNLGVWGVWGVLIYYYYYYYYY
jgi:hypothetical protein